MKSDDLISFNKLLRVIINYEWINYQGQKSLIDN